MLIKKISQSVVSVKSQMSHGTGVVLTKDGYIVTCNHVLAGCNAVKIGQGEKTFNAKIVGTDPYNDIALLKGGERRIYTHRNGRFRKTKRRPIRFRSC